LVEHLPSKVLDLIPGTGKEKKNVICPKFYQQNMRVPVALHFVEISVVSGC
jgi:hypothetical protein